MSIKGTLCRLGVLRLTTSHTQYYKKIDEFGGNFDKIIKSAVKKGSNFLLVRQSQMETPQTLAVTASDESNLALSGQGQRSTQCDTVINLQNIQLLLVFYQLLGETLYLTTLTLQQKFMI